MTRRRLDPEPEATTAAHVLDDGARLKWVIAAAAKTLQETLGRDRANRLRDCGQDYMAGVCLDCGYGSDEPDGIPITCGFRICPECGEERQQTLYRRYADAITDVLEPPIRFLTLTVPNVDELSRDDIDRLKDAWRRFRRAQITPADVAAAPDGWSWAQERLARAETGELPAPTWGDVWTGGIYAIEATWHEATGWNLHMHVLAEGRYAPQESLSAAWERVAGAPVVDVRNVAETRDAVWEVTKYVAKRPATEAGPVTPERAGQKLAELQLATYRTPMIQVWGHAHPNADGPSITADDPDGDGPICPECGSERFYLACSDPELYDLAIKVAGDQDRPPPGNADQTRLDDDQLEPQREGGDEPGSLYPDGPGRKPHGYTR